MAECDFNVPNVEASGDAYYLEKWKEDQSFISYFWNTYGFVDSGTYWDDGFGWESPTDIELPLARTFNACWLLTYSAPSHQIDSYSDAPQGILNWGRRYVRENIDNLRARCGSMAPGSAAARSFGAEDRVDLYRKFWYRFDVAERAAALIHEARHQGGKPHNADFPFQSGLAGQSGADSDWDYEGAWMYGALYLWWFYEEGVGTTILMKNRARQHAQQIIDNCFATHPGFSIA